MASTRKPPSAARTGRMSQMGSALDTEIQSTGMIQPGAHPEFEGPTPLDNAQKFFGNAYNRAVKTVTDVGTTVRNVFRPKR